MTRTANRREGPGARTGAPAGVRPRQSRPSIEARRSPAPLLSSPPFLGPGSPPGNRLGRGRPPRARRRGLARSSLRAACGAPAGLLFPLPPWPDPGRTRSSTVDGGDPSMAGRFEGPARPRRGALRPHASPSARGPGADRDEAGLVVSPRPRQAARRRQQPPTTPPTPTGGRGQRRRSASHHPGWFPLLAADLQRPPDPLDRPYARRVRGLCRSGWLHGPASGPAADSVRPAIAGPAPDRGDLSPPNAPLTLAAGTCCGLVRGAGLGARPRRHPGACTARFR